MRLLKDLVPWSQPIGDGVCLRGFHAIGSDRPIVHFLHGNGFCGLAYAPLLEALYANFDVAITDLQGHGVSDAGKQFPGWNALGAGCLEAMSRQGFLSLARPMYGVGHSLGGIMSLLMAAERPGLFKRLALLDPVLFTPAMLLSTRVAKRLGLMDRSPMVRQTLRRVECWDSRESARSTLHGRGTFRDWREDAFEAYLQHALREDGEGNVTLKCPPWFEAAIFRSVPRGVWASVRKLACPTHFILGDHSHPFIARAARRAARLNPVCTSEIFPGGHCFMQEHPGECAESVRGFLNDAAP